MTDQKVKPAAAAKEKNSTQEEIPEFTNATNNKELDITIFTQEQKNKFLSTDLGIEKNFLSNVKNGINGKIDILMTHVKFLKDTYGNFDEIKKIYFQKDKSNRLSYLKIIIDQYLDLKRKYNLAAVSQFIIQQGEIAKEIENNLFLSLQIQNNYYEPMVNYFDNLKKLLFFYNVEEEDIKPEKVDNSDENSLDNNPDFKNLLFKDNGKNQLHEIINFFGIKFKSEKYLLTQNKSDAAEIIVAIFEFLNSQEIIINYLNEKGHRNWKYIIPYFIHESGDGFTAKELNKAKDKIIDPTSEQIDKENTYIKHIREEF